MLTALVTLSLHITHLYLSLYFTARLIYIGCIKKQVLHSKASCTAFLWATFAFSFTASPEINCGIALLALLTALVTYVRMGDEPAW